MEILDNQKKILQNQELILERLKASKRGDNNPLTPDETQNTDDVMWTTRDTSAQQSEDNRIQRLHERRCEIACVTSMRKEGVTDLDTFYDKCVLDGGDVLLSTSTAELSMTDGAERLVAEYARALERAERPIVRCSASVTESDVCDVWNAEISKCLSQSSNKS